MEHERRALILGKKELLVFNAETGEQVAEVEGLTGAKLLVASPPPAQRTKSPPNLPDTTAVLLGNLPASAAHSPFRKFVRSSPAPKPAKN
jgi:hypothetical protein